VELLNQLMPKFGFARNRAESATGQNGRLNSQLFDRHLDSNPNRPPPHYAGLGLKGPHCDRLPVGRGPWIEYDRLESGGDGGNDLIGGE